MRYVLDPSLTSEAQNVAYSASCLPLSHGVISCLFAPQQRALAMLDGVRLGCFSVAHFDADRFIT
uniref:Uncharacterized protein n=1 Tax=uncultured alpha proteobacterium HF0130_06E21 TaxID=710808 RepID=E0XSZ3_9PROT|nr:hypothetical protein [uncultured alpha proteobacterium HF0130_06E21]